MESKMGNAPSGDDEVKYDYYDENILKDKEKLSEMMEKMKIIAKSLYNRRRIPVEKIHELLDANSAHGLCGSHNLGNTCFMNSAIQCLSNSIDLTYFFLSREYQKEINTGNKHGLKGKLANSWYNLLVEFWIEHNRSTSASSLKQTIAKIAPQFSGFNQQDSHELLTFLLDGLHEDLNKISKKPYMEVAEKGVNETDELAALRFWDLHLKRNDSIMVDLFHGQYRSTITCPECNKVSITFDPYTTVPLPIPDLRKVDIYYLPISNVKKTLKLSIFISDDALFYDINRYLEINAEHIKGKYECMIVVESECMRMLKPGNSIYKAHQKGYLFCCEVDPRLAQENFSLVPVHLKVNEKDELISYPRMLTVTDTMTLKDLRLKVYGFVRKYLDIPQTLLKTLGGEYDSFCEQYTKTNEMSYDELDTIIKNEYQFIFNTIHDKNDTHLQDEINDFITQLPFECYIQGQQGKQILFSSEEILNNSFKNDNENIKDIIEMTQKGNLLIVEFKNGKFLNQEKLKSLHTCINYAAKEKVKALSLNDCLEHFRLTERLQKNNEWYCKDCKKHQEAFKKLELFYTPKLLILHLKRFAYSQMGRYRTYADKITSEIDFPVETLDLSSHVIGPEASKAIYELYAVSQHYGSCGGGHYTAVCKNFGKWYDFNDSSVSQCRDNSIVSSAAYLLFYRRKED